MAVTIDIDPYWVKVPIVIVLLALASFFFRSDAPYPGFPIVGRIQNDFWLHKTKANFRQNARKVIEEGIQRVRLDFQSHKKCSLIGLVVFWPLPDCYIDWPKNCFAQPLRG